MSTDPYAELRRYNMLKGLVRCRIIDNAVTDQCIDPNLLKHAQELFFKKNGLENDEKLQIFLKLNGISRADLNTQLELPLKISTYAKIHFENKAEARFLMRKNDLDKVVYSLLRVKSLNLAKELYLRIEAGEANFADLAPMFSEGPEKTTQGIIGPVPLTQAHVQLAETLRISNPGQLMHPFQIENWWIVARLESYAPAVFNEVISQQMSEELFNQWVIEETNRIICTLPAKDIPTGQQ